MQSGNRAIFARAVGAAGVSVLTLALALTFGGAQAQVRRMRRHFRHDVALEKVLHRAREFRMREPVRRIRLDRQQASKQLVLALRAAFEYLQAARDRVFDRLVIAALEMKQRQLLDGAPVPAVEGAAVGKKQRRCDGARCPDDAGRVGS